MSDETLDKLAREDLRRAGFGFSGYVIASGTAPLLVTERISGQDHADEGFDALGSALDEIVAELPSASEGVESDRDR